MITCVPHASPVPANDQLFLSGFTQQYGTELYVGKAKNPEFITYKAANRIVPVSEINAAKFDAVLYPNPTNSGSSLQIKGNAKDVNVIITDITGKIIWQVKDNNSSQIKLPVEKLAAGVYMLKVESGTDRKTLKLVKE